MELEGNRYTKTNVRLIKAFYYCYIFQFICHWVWVFQNLVPPKPFTASLKTHLNCVLPKLSGLFCAYASFYFTMFFIVAEFLVVVYFVLLKHCLHRVKHRLVVMNMVHASRWIRIAQWIHVYDVKSCFAHGWHRVGVKEGNSLKGKNAKISCLGFNS